MTILLLNKWGESVVELVRSQVPDHLKLVTPPSRDRQVILSLLETADFVITIQMDGEMIEAAPRLKLIQLSGVGFDAIDMAAATRLARRVASLAMEGMALGQAKEDSLAVCRLILESTVWQRASQVMLYVPMSGELNVNSLMENGSKNRKLVALPRFSVKKNAYEACEIDNLSDLVLGKFGVPEPSPDSQIMDTKQLDLVIVPGVAFAGLGGRLGRSGGYSSASGGLSAILRDRSNVYLGVNRPLHSVSQVGPADRGEPGTVPG